MAATPAPTRRSTKKLSMIDTATIAHHYIALWAEATTSADPLMRGEGHDEIDALIAGVQGQFPGFRFALVGIGLLRFTHFGTSDFRLRLNAAYSGP